MNLDRQSKEKKLLRYSENLVELRNNFEISFNDFHKIELISSFISNPFVHTKISEMSQRIANMLNINSTHLEMKIINFQSDPKLKTRILQPFGYTKMRKNIHF